jgi:hypothetical protein
VHAHFADGFFRDASESAAPACMDGSDRAFFCVDQQNRNAVGGLHSEENARRIRERCVTFAWFLWRRRKEQGDR